MAIAILITQAIISSAGAETLFHMRSGRLWYRSDEKVHLDKFLDNFTALGVHVARDPALDLQIEGRCDGEQLEECFDRLLGDLGYVIKWDVVPGPVANILRLNSIEIFKPGHKQDLEAYQGHRNHVLSSYMGRKFVANEVLLGFKGGTKRQEVELLLGQMGGTIADCVESLGIYRIKFSPGTNVPALIKQLERQGVVASAEPNYVTRRQAPERIASSQGSPDFKKLNVSSRQKAYLAVLDSGLSPEQMPKDLIAGSFNALQPDQDIADTAGHGTHMAMIASGLVDPAGTKDSATEGVPLLAVRTFDDNGYTSNYDLMRAIEYSLDNGARVVNLSWGSEHSSSFISTAINLAQSKGAIIVAAAGNEPSGEKIYPAAYSGVIAVGASDGSGKAWSQSNYGDFLFASAPGMATLPTHDGSGAGEYGGTSIASAYVARALARYIARNPDAPPAEVISRFGESLSTFDSSRKRGNGLLDSAALAKFLDKAEKTP